MADGWDFGSGMCDGGKGSLRCLGVFSVDALLRRAKEMEGGREREREEEREGEGKGRRREGKAGRKEILSNSKTGHLGGVHIRTTCD